MTAIALPRYPRLRLRRLAFGPVFEVHYKMRQMIVALVALAVTMMAASGDARASAEVLFFEHDACAGELRWQTIEEFNVSGFVAEIQPAPGVFPPWATGVWSSGFIPAQNPGTFGGALYVVPSSVLADVTSGSYVLCTYWGPNIRSCDMPAEDASACDIAVPAPERLRDVRGLS